MGGLEEALKGNHDDYNHTVPRPLFSVSRIIWVFIRAIRRQGTVQVAPLRGKQGWNPASPLFSHRCVICSEAQAQYLGHLSLNLFDGITWISGGPGMK